MTQAPPTTRLQPCLAVTHGAASHTGLVRPSNQDAFLDRPELGLWAVADGIGGLSQGERASRMVVEALGRLSRAGRLEELAQDVEGCLAQTSSTMRWEAEMGQDGAPMGSTVVALMIQNGAFTCLWAGDSRLYRLRRTVLERLTTDHTSLQDMLAAGHAVPAGPRRRSLGNVLTRAVGTQALLSLARRSGSVEPGDLFLLCSDGLTKVVDEPTIAAMLRNAPRGSEARCLVEAALYAGAPDNVTVVLVGSCAPGLPARPPAPAGPALPTGLPGPAPAPALPGSDSATPLAAPALRAPARPRPMPSRPVPPRRGMLPVLLAAGLLLGLGVVILAMAGWGDAPPSLAAPGVQR